MFSFGERFGAGALSAKVACLEALSEEQRKQLTSASVESPVVFPEAELDRRITTILLLTDSIEEVRRSPIRALKRWHMVNFTLKKLLAFKKQFLSHELLSAAGRLQGKTDETWVRSAVDYVVLRESKLAEKEGRAPNFTSGVVIDEVRKTITWFYPRY
jgi:hypothetical protein